MKAASVLESWNKVDRSDYDRLVKGSQQNTVTGLCVVTHESSINRVLLASDCSLATGSL